MSDELGFRDLEAVHGGEALPSDFSNINYSYMHRPEEEAADARGAIMASQAEAMDLRRPKDPGYFMKPSPSDGELRAEMRLRDVNQLESMRKNIKSSLLEQNPNGYERNDDKIDQHIAKVKSQPYFGQAYGNSNQDQNPYDSPYTENNPKMSLRLQARSNAQVRSKSSMEQGYAIDDEKMRYASTKNLRAGDDKYFNYVYGDDDFKNQS